MPTLTIKAKIVADKETEEIIKKAMYSATKVYNGLMWNLREEFCQTGKTRISRQHLNYLLHQLPRAKDYYSQSVQSTRDEVRDAFKSFFARRRNGRTEARMPGFRRRKYLSPLRYVQSGYSIEGNKVSISLGKNGDRLSFGIQHRPNIALASVENLLITYDAFSGSLEAHLVIEVPTGDPPGSGRCAIDLGETNLITAVFDDGTAVIYSGGRIKSIRRYWQKVRAKVKPPSSLKPWMSRRYRQVARKERSQVNHALHIISKHFVKQCVAKGVGEIVIGDLNGIRDEIDYGSHLNQRLQAWAFGKILSQIIYKAELQGIKPRVIGEAYTSQACYACGQIKPSNRVYRGLYQCSCGWSAHADINGALNIFQKAHHVSPSWSSGAVAAPVVLPYRMDWHKVHEPGCPSFQ
jgi:IS605 OrfB family transposase